MKPLYSLLLALLLSLASPAQDLTISHLPYPGRILLGNKNEIYVGLNSIAREMDMKVLRAGWGYWAGYSPPDELPHVERNHVMVGETIVPMIKLAETNEFFLSAEAFCRGVGGTVGRGPLGELALLRPARPKPRYIPPQEQQLESVVQVPLPPTARDPKKFFVTQYKSAANEDAKVTNGNCLPTTLTMIALAHNALPPGIRADNRQGLILWCREQMTGNSLDEDSGTNFGMVRQLGQKLGLSSRWVDDVDQLDWELRKGRLVAVGGNVQRIGFKSQGSGGHALLVVARNGDNYVINDPGGFYRLPGSLMSAETMKKFFDVGACFWR